MPKLESSVDIKSSPEKFYDFLKNRSFLIPVYSRGTTKSLKVLPEHCTDTKLAYTTERFVDGKTVTMMESIEEDKENNSLVATLVSQETLQAYEILKAIFLVLPKEDGEGSKANLSVEYEKRNQDAPTPDAFLTLMVQLTKDIDAGLTNESKSNEQDRLPELTKEEEELLKDSDDE